MKRQVAIVGAGISGLSCAVLLAEQGCRAAIFTAEMGPGTTSAAAAAIWYPYDAGPAGQTIAWALDTYRTLLDLAGDQHSGVSLLELRRFSRRGEIDIPEWALPLGARRLSSSPEIPCTFASGFTLDVPLMDTSIYLDYLARRFREAGGTIHPNRRLTRFEQIDNEFEIVINCTGLEARTLAQDVELEPHRGQLVIVPRVGPRYAIVCDDEPLMYSIPRTNDCVFGGTNHVSNSLAIDPATTKSIVAECSRVLGIDQPNVTNERVGLRPFRRSGVRVQRTLLQDGRPLIHDYGHGGAGFTLSWGCAREVIRLAREGL